MGCPSIRSDNQGLKLIQVTQLLLGMHLHVAEKRKHVHESVATLGSYRLQTDPAFKYESVLLVARRDEIEVEFGPVKLRHVYSKHQGLEVTPVYGHDGLGAS